MLKLYKDYFYRKFRCKNDSNYFDFNLFNKIWINDKLLKRSPLDAGLPWMTYNAIFFLNHICKRKLNILETGCGGSTIFFLNNCTSLFSIEHDESWLNSLNKKKRIIELSSKWKNKRCNLFNSNTISHEFSPYLNEIKRQQDNTYNLVSIDGRLRSDSLIIASSKVMLGGYILLDNSDRGDYADGMEYLNKLGWRRTNFYGLCYDYNWDSYTSVWQKLKK